MSIADKLGMLQNMKPTPVTLQLADKSLVKLNSIAEDVCVQVSMFIFPIDCMILDMKKDKEVPLILGRPFLATGDAWIGVKDNIIQFNFSGENVVFNVDQAMKYSS